MRKAISVLAVGAVLVVLFGVPASAGAGRLIGTPGDDKMAGTDAAAGDTMAALGGRDTVDARGGQDSVFGGPGDDGGMDGPSLYGDSPDHETDSSLDGDDAVRGGPGSDTLHGFGGDDLLAGGVGNDRIFAADGHADRIDCGQGEKDSAHFDRGLDVVLDCEIRNRGT